MNSIFLSPVGWVVIRLCFFLAWGKSHKRAVFYFSNELKGTRWKCPHYPGFETGPLDTRVPRWARDGMGSPWRQRHRGLEGNETPRQSLIWEVVFNVTEQNISKPKRRGGIERTKITAQGVGFLWSSFFFPPNSYLVLGSDGSIAAAAEITG